MTRYSITKTYSPERGLSCVFRQWRAQSHCRFLHGYALGVSITLSSAVLDERNWVYDYGDFKWVKAFLEEHFDHTTCIAADDPELAHFLDLAARHLIQLRVLPAVGNEAFARFIYEHIAPRITADTHGRVHVDRVTVSEHNANSASYEAV
jgi:6-pyruvoyltetrahydropterin/6-carboxytetrahydropterin synthase